MDLNVPNIACASINAEVGRFGFSKKFIFTGSTSLTHPIRTRTSAIVLAAMDDPRGHGHETSREKWSRLVLKIDICTFDLRLRCAIGGGLFLAGDKNRRSSSVAERSEDRPLIVCACIASLKVTDRQDDLA